ncbi:MAG: hypothetical protein AVDCRST_MAG95-3009 [uncultured Adhaeribacter sp.]|uniref:STAS/SEC14 domain-containing protein n=1 Tax=uncultured Adhaeribacter sp. TaxID=448109 RepID=A0A6J4JBC6_9BACT|nr:MAG: hypothetical protein AVDCRST_MAG95-3009 [uncultured Adhaeribacter sp.]
MKVYHNEQITIFLEKRIHLLHLVWTGIPTSENFYNAFIASLQVAVQHQVKKWLIDQRNLTMFNPKDLQWWIQQWLPEAARHLSSKSKIAIIQHDLNQFGKLGSDRLLRAVFALNANLKSRYFLQEDEAREWLVPKNRY